MGRSLVTPSRVVAGTRKNCKVSTNHHFCCTRRGGRVGRGRDKARGDSDEGRSLKEKKEEVPLIERRRRPRLCCNGGCLPPARSALLMLLQLPPAGAASSCPAAAAAALLQDTLAPRIIAVSAPAIRRRGGRLHPICIGSSSAARQLSTNTDDRRAHYSY